MLSDGITSYVNVAKSIRVELSFAKDLSEKRKFK